MIQYFFYYTPFKVIIKYWLCSPFYTMTPSEKWALEETWVCVLLWWATQIELQFPSNQHPTFTRNIAMSYKHHWECIFSLPVRSLLSSGPVSPGPTTLLSHRLWEFQNIKTPTKRWDKLQTAWYTKQVKRSLEECPPSQSITSLSAHVLFSFTLNLKAECWQLTQEASTELKLSFLPWNS